MTIALKHGVYGGPPAELAEVPPSALQYSPLLPGSENLELAEAGSLAGFTLLAPPGTLERRYTLALALRALAAGAPLLALAPKDKGGSRLAGELKLLGCEAEESARRHHRICLVHRPAILPPLDPALAGGQMRELAELGLWSQPGLFSWDRLDPGTELLAQNLPVLSGTGADFGCGLGVLARHVLASPKVKFLHLVDLDRRALAATARNLHDPRTVPHWDDVRHIKTLPPALDFIVMNPPFHDNGHEDHNLGQEFVRAAAARLRKGGTLWLVANRHLPYEGVLKSLFSNLNVKAEARGFKVFEARK